MASSMRVSYSALSTFERCPRRYYWEYVKGLCPIEESRPLRIGRAVHELLAKHYSGKSVSTSSQALRPFGLANSDQQLVRYMSSLYFEQWSDEPDEWDRDEIVQVESSFEVPLSNGSDREGDVRLVGRIDLVVNNPEPDEEGVVVVDHKTTSKGLESIDEELVGSTQLLLYSHALREGGLNPTRGLYNVIRTKVPTTPRVNRDGTLHRSYVVTTPDLYRRAMDKTGCVGRPWSDHLTKLERYGNPFLRRIDFPIRSEMIDQVVEASLKVAQQIRRCEDGNNWPDDDERCFDYGVCPFCKICSKPTEPAAGELAFFGLEKRARQPAG